MAKESVRVSFRDYIRRSEWVWETQVGGQKKTVGIKCFACNAIVKDSDIARHFDECIISKPKVGKCAEELDEAKAKFRNLSSLYIRAKDEVSALKNEISSLNKDSDKLKAAIRGLNSAHLKARTEISDLKKELAEVVEARTLTTAIPESWGWSDCFFCSKPIKDNATHDVFMGKSIHKECREKLIDGLNASYREKEKKEKEENES